MRLPVVDSKCQPASCDTTKLLRDIVSYRPSQHITSTSDDLTEIHSIRISSQRIRGG
ncbi:hypothetical protein PIIN_10991 [Serendipita indica DSM 11827]|uniref:Uncharacterized protein n=1 Tax=Serendipita indica (strain DSM 11827) TaxID=1109443 RepID=G4U0B3_SERID|nr:hypothetical protein PIIN_10991 [Serendipita indica DSM 11827]